MVVLFRLSGKEAMLPSSPPLRIRGVFSHAEPHSTAALSGSSSSVRTANACSPLRPKETTGL